MAPFEDVELPDAAVRPGRRRRRFHWVDPCGRHPEGVRPAAARRLAGARSGTCSAIRRDRIRSTRPSRSCSNASNRRSPRRRSPGGPAPTGRRGRRDRAARRRFELAEVEIIRWTGTALDREAPGPVRARSRAGSPGGPERKGLLLDQLATLDTSGEHVRRRPGRQPSRTADAQPPPGAARATKSPRRSLTDVRRRQAPQAATSPGDVDEDAGVGQLDGQVDADDRSVARRSVGGLGSAQAWSSARSSGPSPPQTSSTSGCVQASASASTASVTRVDRVGGHRDGRTVGPSAATSAAAAAKPGLAGGRHDHRSGDERREGPGDPEPGRSGIGRDQASVGQGGRQVGGGPSRGQGHVLAGVAIGQRGRQQAVERRWLGHRFGLGPAEGQASRAATARPRAPGPSRPTARSATRAGRRPVAMTSSASSKPASSKSRACMPTVPK